MWKSSEIEAAFELRLPDEIKALWNKASEIQMNYDFNYGQWGCVLWSPSEIKARHEKALAWRGAEFFRPGDLVIGEFLGDTDLIVVRCEAHQADFGTIIIAMGMDPRDQWPAVASSIGEFIMNFLSHPERKYWERAE